MPIDPVLGPCAEADGTCGPGEECDPLSPYPLTCLTKTFDIDGIGKVRSCGCFTDAEVRIKVNNGWWWKFPIARLPRPGEIAAFLPSPTPDNQSLIGLLDQYTQEYPKASSRGEYVPPPPPISLMQEVYGPPEQFPEFMNCSECLETCVAPNKCWRCPNMPAENSNPVWTQGGGGCMCTPSAPPRGCRNGYYDVRLREETLKKNGCLLRCDGLKRGDPPHQTETQREFILRRWRCKDNCSQYTNQ